MLADPGRQDCRDTSVATLCDELGITRQTLYRHVAPDGTLRTDGKKALGMLIPGEAAHQNEMMSPVATE